MHPARYPIPTLTKEPPVADAIDPKDRSTENMEYRIAEPALWVLDFVGRMCQAITTGDWDEVEDNATRIAQRAEQLAEAAGEAAQERRPRADAVVAMMTSKNNPENRLFQYTAVVEKLPRV
jgi:cobalamin biosynthesis Mg chelatase CobN